jgi:hypothetical protein
MPAFWMHSDGVRLVIDSSAGPLYVQPLNIIPLRAVGYPDGEIVRYTWDWTDPETGEVTRGAGRLVYEPLPDPRAEVQPAPPAEATADPFTTIASIDMNAPRQPSGYDAYVAGRFLQPAEDESTTGERWIERPSGPPVKVVDGPGCTPATVRLCGKPLGGTAICARPPEHEGDCGEAPASSGAALGPWERCWKCTQPFGSTDARLQHADMPFCRECVDRCHDSEIADHWCVVDQWRNDNRRAPEGEQ